MATMPKREITCPLILQYDSVSYVVQCIVSPRVVGEGSLSAETIGNSQVQPHIGTTDENNPSFLL